MYASQPSNVPQRTARHHFMMYTSRARIAFQHQQFFFEQKEKLSNLLNSVGQDARIAAGQPACMDYYELTTVITQLLEEAQILSALTYEQIERSGIQMQPFAEKVQLVESVAAEVRVKTFMAAAPKPVSRKRGRMMDEEEEDMSSTYKRNRGFGVDQDMMVEPAFCGPYAERHLQTAWWTQPICE